MNIKIIYFDTPFWRAEVARLALFIGGVDFKDVRVDREEFNQIKLTGATSEGIKIPFKQLPVLSVDGQSISQTGAIARYCGKLSNLYSDEILVCAQIDQIIDLMTEINGLIRPSMIENDPEKKKLLRAELSDILLPKKIQFLEDLIADNDENDYCVANQLSIADLAVWRCMGWLSTGIIDGISMDLIKPFQRVYNVCWNIEHNPKVIEWISRTYPDTYGWLRDR